MLVQAGRSERSSWLSRATSKEREAEKAELKFGKREHYCVFSFLHSNFESPLIYPGLFGPVNTDALLGQQHGHSGWLGIMLNESGGIINKLAVQFSLSANFVWHVYGVCSLCTDYSHTPTFG